MARMHPDDIEALENATPGERTVFRFLREAARPDLDFIGWYEPAIREQGKYYIHRGDVKASRWNIFQLLGELPLIEKSSASDGPTS